MASTCLAVTFGIMLYEVAVRRMLRGSGSRRASGGVSAARREPGTSPSSQSPQNGGTARADLYDTQPRKGSLSWAEYFMAVAFLSAQRSKDPSKQVGACIVGRNKVILGIGYNGFPRGCGDHALPWAKKSAQGFLGTKYPYVVHAEANALLNTNNSDVTGATIYVTMVPCNECAKLLIQAGIAEVIYAEGKQCSDASALAEERAEPGASANRDAYVAAFRLLKMAGVKVEQYRGPTRTIHL